MCRYSFNVYGVFLFSLYFEKCLENICWLSGNEVYVENNRY